MTMPGYFCRRGTRGAQTGGNRIEPAQQLTMGLWRPPVLPSSLEADLVLMRSTLQAHEMTNTTLKHMRSKFRHVACHTRPLAFADLIIFPTFSSPSRVYRSLPLLPSPPVGGVTHERRPGLSRPAVESSSCSASSSTLPQSSTEAPHIYSRPLLFMHL